MSIVPESLAKLIFLRGLESLTGGSILLRMNGHTQEFGERKHGLQATLEVQNDRFFHRAVFGGDVGLGESWMDGDWSSPDLVALVRLAVRNRTQLENDHRWLRFFSSSIDTLRHRRRDNTVSGSRRNIQAHYDLSNDFFRLFLDSSMMYSCAFYHSKDDSLEQAQFQKLDRICQKLRLSSGDHVLEIGTGWGGFAEHAVKHYGCRVTTTTISKEQHLLAQERFATFDKENRIELLLEDYRNLRGQYDKIVSIEMFEAVGLSHYDDFFRACDRLLRPDGSMLLQTIHINEQAFPVYPPRVDWIQNYIFPGAELASLSEILKSLARATSLGLYHAEDIGTHYARTLAEWRRRFRMRFRRCAHSASTNASCACGISIWDIARVRSWSATSATSNCCSSKTTVRRRSTSNRGMKQETADRPAGIPKAINSDLSPHQYQK